MSKSVRRQLCIIIQSMICVITSLLESTAFGQMLQPGVLLERMKSIDSVYAAGLMVSGTFLAVDRRQNSSIENRASSISPRKSASPNPHPESLYVVACPSKSQAGGRDPEFVGFIMATEPQNLSFLYYLTCL